MRRSLETAALGLSGLGLGLAAAAPSAAGARLELSTAHAAVLIGAGLWARALSSAFAGALVDRFGGRRGLAVAAAGAGACGLAFAALASRERGAFAALVLLNAASGYFVSFAGPSAARLNSDAAEAARGRLAGLYAALAFPAALLVLAPGGPWLESHAGRWLAALPAAAAALAFAASRFAPAEPAAKEERASLKELPATARDPRVLALAGLEACAGAARWGLLAWAAPFLAEAHHVRPGDPAYGTALASVAAGALAGPLIAGAVSDKAFGGRRAPAGLAFFLFLAAALAALGRTLDAAHAIVWLGLAAGAAFGLHALLCGAAAMDAGGARAAGSVSGLLDSAHHAAGGLAVLLVGSLVDRGGWGAWTKGLIPFALLGAAACAAAVRLRAEARNPSL